MGESPSAVVVALHLHPVKSCRRVEVERAVVGRYGLQGDREWQVQTPDGRVMTQRTFPQLARVRATPVGDGLRLAYEGLADLEVQRPAAVDTESARSLGPVSVADAGDGAAAWFERVVGGPCRLTAIAAGYHRRIVIDGDLFGQEVSLADAAPVHLVNAASHRFLLERAAEPFGIERFRPNVVVDSAKAWEEDTWRHVSVGATDLEIVLPWPRCAVTQVDQDTGQRHREPAGVLRQHRWCDLAPSLPEALRPLVEGNALFGIAGSIGPEGAGVSVGDDVVVGVTGPALLVPPASPR